MVLERWGGSVPLEGRVRLIEPTAFTKISALGVEEQRVRTMVDFTSLAAKWARLRDGYRVEASFILLESKDAVQVAASALFRYQEKWAAFVMENGLTRRRPVETGRRNGVSAEVLSGLAVGELVIAHPDDTIREGIAIKPR